MARDRHLRPHRGWCKGTGFVLERTASFEKGLHGYVAASGRKARDLDGRRHQAFLLGGTRCLRDGNRKRVEGIARGSVTLELDLDHVLGTERWSLFCIANLYHAKHLSSNGKNGMEGTLGRSVNGLECHTQ